MKASNFDELLPINGMKLGTAFAGILDVDHKPDVVVIEIDNASNTAALFTSSSFKAPPVIVSKNKISLMNSVLFIVAEFISPAILAAIAILKIFEPTMLPIIKSVLSLLAD